MEKPDFLQSMGLQRVKYDLVTEHSTSANSVQFSHTAVSSFVPIEGSPPGFPVHHHSQSLFKLMSIQLVVPSNHLILCHSPVSSYLQSLTASDSFQMGQFFTSGGQSIGISTSASVLSMNIQDWFPLGSTGFISLQFKGLLKVFSNTTV